METLMNLANKCFQEKGVYPISFSLPYPIIDLSDHVISKKKEMATVIPGKMETYIFENQKDYYDDYKSSKFGITKKKAGWDCFRHLEIIYNCCVPLFEDIDSCPIYNMIHYPKSDLSFIRRHRKLLSSNSRFYMQYLHKIVRHYNSYLTCQKMVEYTLKMTGHFQRINSILFIDSKIPSQVDYLSVTYLIGLKQMFGENCEVLFPVDYIYEDTNMDTSLLYGKGFSCTRVLDPNLKTEFEKNKETFESIVQKIKRKEFDLIVYGSIVRCLDRYELIKETYPKSKIIGLQGEDISWHNPSIYDLTNSLKKEMNLFVREFEGPNNYS